MSTTQKYTELITSFNNTLLNFENSLKIITLQFDVDIVDTLKSGQIQKFEITAEIAWKCCKLYSEIKLGESIAAPKQVYKLLLVNEVIKEDLYLYLLETVDDRNKLSHIYKEDMYNSIYQNLQKHLTTLQTLYTIINEA